jgi:hypothetical protein
MRKCQLDQFSEIVYFSFKNEVGKVTKWSFHLKIWQLIIKGWWVKGVFLAHTSLFKHLEKFTLYALVWKNSNSIMSIMIYNT